MKGWAVPSKDQQRKEARRKEAAMPTTNQHETEDRKKPRRAIIYLSEPVPNDLDEPRDELSIDQQLVLCRCVATGMQYEVVGEFTDSRADLASRPGLHQAIAVAETQRPDILIVSSLERLADSYHDITRIAWKLGRAGTVPVPAEVGIGLPAKVRPSQD
jgi:Resolvase, N terminal domain